jgi:hypothetical protein
MDSDPDGPADGRLVHKRPASWQARSMLCRRPSDAVAGGDEVAGRSLFQQSRRPTSRIAQVLTSDCNAAYNKLFDEQQLLPQVIARGLEGVGRTVLHRHLSESNIEL